MSTAKKLFNDLLGEIKGIHPKVEATYMQLVEMYPLQPINSKKQHELALNIAELLIMYTNKEGSADEGAGIYLKTLAELIGDYERKNFELPKVGGSEMLAYLMELQGLNQTDLSYELGGQSVVSQILKGKRELNLRQVRALAKRFKVSPEVFIE